MVDWLICIPGGRIEGDIRINGYPKKHRTFTRVAGYVEQNDIHSPQASMTLTAQVLNVKRLDKLKLLFSGTCGTAQKVSYSNSLVH